MIRLFLDVYRLENAEITVSWALLDVAPVVDEVLRQQARMAELHGVTLVTTGHAAPLPSDVALVQRIVDNLVDNAIRHARSRVEVTVRDGDEALEVDVTDDGAGIADEVKGRLFDKFASMSADLRGYNQGLGLTFCALASRRLGGEVVALDNPPAGSRFRLRLPRGVGDGAAPTPA
ncbi:MAG: ATP-binding protein [Myxococcales bacterium]|nr:MAG: ATP-binding protein [Myxococcales bacterium]